MCKNFFFFQSSGTKKELFKVQGRKTNFIQSLGTKTILLPIFFYWYVKKNSKFKISKFKKKIK
jgi:hypothetical protein